MKMRKQALLPVMLMLLAFLAGYAEHAAAQATAQTFAKPELVRPFRIEIDQKRIDAILQRVRTAKLPRQMPATSAEKAAWETGADIQWLEGLREYWANQFDWRAAEAWLNRYPQHKARVDDVDIHFYYVKGEGSNPLPLLLTHGWPGSVVEFLDVIGPLTQPSKHGGRAEDAFTVIIPSLPGYAFSDLPADMNIWNTTTRLWHKLVTEVIGHERYVAQGGDEGSEITVLLAYHYPRSVKAIHLNLLPWGQIPADQQTPEEKVWATTGDAYMTAEFDYLRLQVNKPMMPSVALADSPMGTAAWIAEKFYAWSDNNGDLDKTFSKDLLLTNIMLYLLSDSGVEGSFRFYRAIRDELRWEFLPGRIEVPTSVALFPRDYPMGRPPLETAKRWYNIVRYTPMPRGGHFPALEQPDLFVKDLRESFRSAR
jgi:pimeloyl-ACP methyl ester carboxylesterase